MAEKSYFNCFYLLKYQIGGRDEAKLEKLKKKSVKQINLFLKKHKEKLTLYLISTLDHLIHIKLISSETEKIQFFLKELVPFKSLFSKQQKNKFKLYNIIYLSKNSQLKKAKENLNRISKANYIRLKCSYFAGGYKKFDQDLKQIYN